MFFTKTSEKYLLYLGICQFIAKILADLRNMKNGTFPPILLNRYLVISRRENLPML
jgi:hypothetical protein